MNQASVNRSVTIIVPYFNSREYIGRLIDTISRQIHDDFLCLLIDDGGCDGSYEFVSERISEDSRFLNLKRPDGFKPGGRGAKNYGFSLCNSPYTVFFDSDDVMHERYLEDRMRYLNDNPGKDGVVSDFGWRVIHGQAKRIYRYNRRIFDDFKVNVRQDWFWLHYMDYRFWFNPGNPMWRTSSIKYKPMWDESTSIGEDHEYHARLMLAGLDIGIIEGVHWDYMANPGSMISTSESISPLLSRSYGKMLVLENILRELGHREALIRKELTWQVKILRRIMQCRSNSSQMELAELTMMNRIQSVMDILGYSVTRKALIKNALKTSIRTVKGFGRGYSLYDMIVNDKHPTKENTFFTIS